jgi:hypothetical protein
MTDHHPTLHHSRPLPTEVFVDPTQQQHLVNEHLSRLAAEASAERLARRARHARAGHPADELDANDTVPARDGLRVVIGRALIGLGTAIAASGDDADAAAGRVA